MPPDKAPAALGSEFPTLPRCWCEVVNGKRHLANGCPKHDPAPATPFVSVENERDFWKEQAHMFERKAASLMAEVVALRERAERIDALAAELREKDGVPAEVLTPIHVYAVTLRGQARKMETKANG